MIRHGAGVLVWCMMVWGINSKHCDGNIHQSVLSSSSVSWLDHARDYHATVCLPVAPKSNFRRAPKMCGLRTHDSSDDLNQTANAPPTSGFLCLLDTYTFYKTMHVYPVPITYTNMLHKTPLALRCYLIEIDRVGARDGF
jgi:hypothetical protein